MVYPVSCTAVDLQVRKKLGWSVQFFFWGGEGSGPPNPSVVAPLILVGLLFIILLFPPTTAFMKTIVLSSTWLWRQHHWLSWITAILLTLNSSMTEFLLLLVFGLKTHLAKNTPGARSSEIIGLLPTFINLHTSVFTQIATLIPEIYLRPFEKVCGSFNIGTAMWWKYTACWFQYMALGPDGHSLSSSHTDNVARNNCFRRNCNARWRECYVLL